MKEEIMFTRILVRALAAGLLLVSTTATVSGKGIIHDSEYYVLEAQYGEKWAQQDKSLDAKLKELRKKHGKPPNIIHIMWDDTPVVSPTRG